MRKIPIAAAKRIAEEYGYDQVVIYGRNCIENSHQHMTTYGRTRVLCDAAGKIGRSLQKFMGWP